ncbi:hypothetical protein [Neosynechococcus sphagnicola]|nr:hypothetical protein [Neosynechococcus sphagnicola]
MPNVKVLAVPVGLQPLRNYLYHWIHQDDFQKLHQPRIVIMGLCGSLQPVYGVGDGVIYRGCLSSQPSEKFQVCDSDFTARLQTRFPTLPLVTAWSSDRLMVTAQEKRHLGQTTGAAVVDMEGAAALEVLADTGASLAMVRVVSDDCHHDLPDITAALSLDGSLLPLPLALGLIRQPLAAARLIQGSWRGLTILRHLTTQLLTPDLEPS